MLDVRAFLALRQWLALAEWPTAPASDREGLRMLQFLNVFFFVFHTVLMVFNCLGWIWKRTRLWHLAAVTLTALSWFGMGYWHGWGYCICTDWHWQVRERLGYPDDHSYTHLLIREVTGLDLSPNVTDFITVGVFALAAVLTIVLNVWDFLRLRKDSPQRHKEHKEGNKSGNVR